MDADDRCSGTEPGKDLAGSCCKEFWSPRVLVPVPASGARGDTVVLWPDPGAGGLPCCFLDDGDKQGTEMKHWLFVKGISFTFFPFI